jgi:superfamily I DNA/RNA helicase/RecB family exonuclease
MSSAGGSIGNVAPHPFDPDPQQQAVLRHERGPLLVLGEAGTGKTTVLRERFARLVEEGADPERIALVVRSKLDRGAARAALLERLRSPLSSLRVFTAHALAFHVMGVRYRALGFTEPPRVLSAANHFAKVRELLLTEDPAGWHALGGLLEMRGFADQIRQFVLRAQERLVTPEDLLERPQPWVDLGRFYRRYLDTLAAEGSVDFAGLVARAAEASEDGDAAFDHVLVDDYQDATISLERLVRHLGASALVVTGNPDAHVFSFQGTTDMPLGRFAAQLAASVVTLATRHRGDQPSIEGWRAPHVAEELAAVARELRRVHVEDEVPWSRLAVVTRRQGSQTAALVRALDDAGVPHTALEGSGRVGPSAATAPYVLALRWLVADDAERDQLVSAVLTSQLGGLSPASARALLRSARASGRPARDALEVAEGLTPEESASLEALRRVLAAAAEQAGSVLDAFGTLWRELVCSAQLVAAAEDDPQARVDLDELVGFARAVEEAGTSADPSIQAFLAALQAREGAPELAGPDPEPRDAARVLTAHGTAGLEFDTVFVVGAVEGNFPSLARPEPMFDLADLEGRRSRSQVNRARLADERRLFGLVVDRATRRVVLTTSRPEGEDAGVAAPSRFAEERGVVWEPAPVAPFAAPVSVAEAAATWRRTLADTDAPAARRLAALDGLLALGVDPRRWWFLLDWSAAGAPAREELYLSYSRLDSLENCTLQYALGSELGLDTRSGHQAWVGHLIHSMIEDCENGLVERTPEGFVAELERRWREDVFPSYAISEAERRHAITVLIPNWFERYGDLPAAATEHRFRFGFDGAIVNGVIDRIGPVPEGGTRITDFKTGHSDNAGRAAENLQLGIYYLAVHECDELAEHRPVSGVELAYLGGRKAKKELVILDWPVREGAEEDYKQRMRERLSGLIGRIRELDRTGRYVPETGANCHFCGFQSLCPRYPEGGSVFPVPTAEPEEVP